MLVRVWKWESAKWAHLGNRKQIQCTPALGQVGTILAAYQVNIGEWRMGRHAPGSEGLSFINLDSEPPAVVLDALEKVPAITQVKLIRL